MSADVDEQPAAVVRALDQAALVAADLERPRAALLFGRGTSEHAALYGKYLFETVAHVPTAIGAPSVATLYGARIELDGWLAIGVSQSGHTREIHRCLEWAAGRGAATLAITNVVPSPLSRTAQATLGLDAGEERAVAATKTFVAECAAFAQLAHCWSGKRVASAELSELIDSALAEPLDQDLVETLGHAALCLVLGRGAHTAMAAELALKLMEGCQIWSWGGSWADLLHGPITALPSGTPALAFPGDARMSGSWSEARGQLVSRGFRVWPVGLGDGRVGSLGAIADIVIGQRIVLAAALRRGTDPDRPPGLQKVTQT